MSTIFLKDNITNKTASIDSSELDQALATNQYRVETPAEAKTREFLNDPSNQGIKGQAKTALMSFANEALMGVPDAAIKGLADEQTVKNLEALKEKNPVTSAVSGIAGFGASLFTGEPLFEGAAKIGQAIEKGGISLADRIGKESLSKSMASSITNKILTPTAKLASEGVVVSTPKALTQLITGDPDEAAETLTAGALAGGVLGGTMGLGKIAGEALSPTKDILSRMIPEGFKIKNGTQSAYDYWGMTVPQARKLPGDISDQLKDWTMNNIAKTASGGPDISALQPEVRQAKLANILESSGQKIGDTLDQLDSVLKTALPLAKKSEEGMNAVYKWIDDSENFWTKSAQKLREEYIPEGILDKAGNVKFDEARSVYQPIIDFLDNINSTASQRTKISQTPTMITDYRRTLDEIINFTKNPMTKTLPEKMQEDFRRMTKDYINETLAPNIEDIAKTVPDLAIPFRGMADTLKQANNDYRMAKTLIPFAESDVIRDAKSKGLGFYNMFSGGIGAAVAGVPGAIGAVLLQQTLPQVRRLGGLYFGDSKLIDMVRNVNLPEIFNHPSITKETSAKAVSALNRLISNFDEKDDYKKINKTNEILSKLATNPEALSNLATNMTSEISQINPNITPAFAAKFTNAISKLQQIAPKTNVPTTVLDPTPTGLSTMEVKDFERKITTIMEPHTILNDIANGTVTPDQIYLLKQLYPATYLKYANSLTNYISNPEVKLSNLQRNKIKLFLDLTDTKGMVQLQAIHNSPAASVQHGPEGTPLKINTKSVMSQQDRLLFKNA